MKTRTSIYDFKFQFAGHGHYRVVYTSPVTGKQWSTITSDMSLIDATKSAEEPKRKDLDMLKWICKNK